MNIANVIRNLRRSNHYTQEKLAEICGVSRQAVAKWESGANFPDIEKIVQLSEIFHVSVDELLTGKAPSPSTEKGKAPSQGNALAENEKMVNQALKNALSYRDPNEEIDQFISFIGKQIGCSRTYIFEVNPDESYRNTYEWCNSGVTPEIEHLQNIPLKDISPWLDAFSREGRVFIEDVDAIMRTQPVVYRWLKPQGIKSILAYPLFGGRAFIGIDNPIAAFMEQTSQLMEILAYFVEIMIRQRDMAQDLKRASLRDEQLSEFVKGVRFQIDVTTGELQYDANEVRDSGYDFSFKTLAELEEFTKVHLEFRDHLMIDGIQKALESKENLTVEFLSYRSNRQIRWNKFSVRPFLDARGKVIQLYGVVRDASSEHRIIEQYNRYISHLSGGLHVCYLSKPIHLDYVSDDLCVFLGYEREDFDQLVGSRFTNVIAESDRASFNAYVRRLSEAPGIESCEYSLKKKDGSLVRVIDTMESIRDSNGIMYGYSYVLKKSQFPALLEMAEENEKRQLALINVQSEVMASLGKDYLNVFRVWLDEDKAQIVQLDGYVTKGMDKRSADYLPYYRFCRQYVQDRVCSEDKQKMLEAMHPDAVRRAFEQDDEYTVVYRALENGEAHFYQMKYVKLPSSSDQAGISFVAGFKSVDNVIREEHGKNERLQEELNIIQAILQAFTCGYYIDYKNRTYLELSCDNQDITKIVGTGGTLEEVAERTKVTFPDKSAYEQIYELIRSDDLDARLGGQGYLTSQVFIEGFGWYDVILLVVDRDEEGKVFHAVYLARDITEEKNREVKYEHSLNLANSRERLALQMAYTDVLTQVMNRAAFERDFRAIDECGQIGFVYCDVNGLKGTNDTYGHSQGDELLKCFAEILRKNFSVDCIYRVGGDEFVCLIGKIGKESFDARVGKFVQEISECGGMAAVGWAHGDAAQKESLLKQAEDRMYETKRREKEERGKAPLGEQQ